jgi:hypothetical protein
MPDTPTPHFIEGLYQAMRKRAADLAPHFAPGYGTKAMTPDDLDAVWNRRAMPLEQEWELHRQKKDDGTPLYTPAQIGLLVFPEREKLAKSGGRVEPSEWISWSNQQAKRQAAKREAQQRQLETPPPMEGESNGLV